MSFVKPVSLKRHIRRYALPSALIAGSLGLSVACSDASTVPNEGDSPQAEATQQKLQQTGASDARFEVYGPASIKGVDFGFRNGGTSAETCANGACTGDFITVGQLNDRSWGPYANLDTGTVFKKWHFLRAQRPAPRWDCNTGLSFSVTNWITTTRCIDQMGSDKYEEIVRNILGVTKGQEYKQDILDQQFAAEAPQLPTIMRKFIQSQRGTPLIFEIGNEPNVFASMSPTMYAAYYKRWVDEIRRVAALPEFAGSVTVQTMPAGLWISEGEPEYLRSVLDQGIAVAFGRITISVPTGVGICGPWYLPYPCVKFSNYDLTPGVDVKGRFYMDTNAYLKQFLAAIPAGYVDYGNLHFYPYVATDAAYGQNQMAPHINNLRSLAALYAPSTNSKQVWLTEFGNFNPYSESDTITNVMTPMLTSLKANEIPQISRWYWFESKGEDKKFSMIPKGANSVWFVGALVAGDSAVKGIDALFGGALFHVVRPVTDSTTVARIALRVGDYSAQNPVQGLIDSNGNLRAMGNVYYNFAMSPVAGATCGGSSGQWSGCRGNGCSVCSELLTAYPNYYRNHPNCSRNDACAGFYGACNNACSAPDDTDR